MRASQKIINRAAKIIWEGLKSQGFRRAMDSLGNCQYTTPDGRHCAVGWLVPGFNDKGTILLSEKARDALRNAGYPIRLHGDKCLNRLTDFIVRAQRVHDCAYYGDMAYNLTVLFKQFDVPEIIYAEPNQQSSEADVGRPEIAGV